MTDENKNEIKWGFDDIQVRILTVDAGSVVRATVDPVSDGIEDVHVIAEEQVEVAGATVHAVPDEFDCDATNKRRAVEWARRHVSCNWEYVLYLTRTRS